MRAEVITDLIDTHGKEVYGFCRRLAKTKENADDLYQQTFLRALELSDKIDVDNNPKGYLIAIAVRQWQNYISKAARHQRIAPIDYDSSREKLEAVASSSHLETEVENNLIIIEIEAIVEGLPDKLRIPVIMYYNGEQPFKAIARALKIPEGTVKSRIHTARKIIKEGLEAKGYEGL